MARYQHAVVWTRISGTPEKMGTLVLSEREATFTYTDAYLSSGQPGFCLLGDGALWKSDTITYPISERIPVFPRLLSLIPGNHPRNLQRRHYLDILRAKSGKEPPLGMETEWRLLMMGGHGGIGHIDLFADDMDATGIYYRTAPFQNSRALTKASNGRSQLWRMLKRQVLDEHVDFDSVVIEKALGATPSVNG